MSHAYARTGLLPDSHSSSSASAMRDEPEAEADEPSQNGHYTVALGDESQSMEQPPLQQRTVSVGADGEESSSSKASPHAALVAPAADRITVHSLYRSNAAAHEALLSKLTLRLLPFLLVLYTFSFLDRSNLSNVQHVMVKDLGLTIEQYGTAASIFFVPYVLLEIPSNMILERVDARRWLARIIFSWGLIATLMLAIRSFGALVLARFLLGVAEAGFFPGIIFYLTLWFTPKERAQRLAFIFVAQPFSGILGGLLAYPILNYMDGVGGMAGWRWVFLLEGTPTVFLGVATWYYLPAKPSEASWLSAEEKLFLTMRMKGVTAHGEMPSEQDELQQRRQHSRTSSRSNSTSSEHATELTPAISHDGAAASDGSPVAAVVGVGMVSPPPRSWRTRLELSYAASLVELKSLYRSTFSNRIIYLCILCNFLILMPVQAITFYLPAIVGELGVGALAANGISAIPYTVAMVSLFAVSIHSDRKQERVWHIIACNVLGFVALAATAATLSVERVSEGSGGGGKTDLHLVFWQLFFLSLTAAGVWGCKPALMALFTANLRGNIAVAIAAVTTVGNLSGIIAPIVMSALRAGSGNYASGCLFLMACLVLASITVHQLHREIEKQARLARGVAVDRAEQMELSVLQNRAEEPSSSGREPAEDDSVHHSLDVEDSSLVHLSPSDRDGYSPSRSQVHAAALSSPAVESPAMDVDVSYSQQRHVTSKLN